MSASTTLTSNRSCGTLNTWPSEDCVDQIFIVPSLLYRQKIRFSITVITTTTTIASQLNSKIQPGLLNETKIQKPTEVFMLITTLVYSLSNAILYQILFSTKSYSLSDLILYQILFPIKSYSPSNLILYQILFSVKSYPLSNPILYQILFSIKSYSLSNSSWN